MVASLQKTPYRPSMTVLGSRDRMCIHAAIQDKNINHECRARKKETEAVRKWQLQSEDFFYSDENPPAQLETDDLEAPVQDESTSTEQKPTCSHYRQLGASRTADNMIQNFRPSGNANADGDESTKDGTFDIEDLVQFGKNPYKRTVVLKKRPEERWGILLSLKVGAQYPHAENVLPSGIAAKSGAIKKGDLIFSYNNSSTAFPDISALCSSMIACPEQLTLVVGTADDEVSPHSACPYYMSRALEKHAELVFCPYNYILDPGIRDTLKINLENTVVVLDEAHNVEDVLRDSGSGKWSEFDMCTIISHLQRYSNSNLGRKTETEGGEEEVSLREMAHALLLVVERIVLFLFDEKSKFEENGGAKKALEDWEKFHTPDTQSFETSYFGPSGHGVRGQSIGCKPFFDRLDIRPEQGEKLCTYAEEMFKLVVDGEAHETTFVRPAFEKMVDLVKKLCLASTEPQDFFVQSAVQANGGFAFAAGASTGAPVAQRRGRQRNPRSTPYAHGRSANHSNKQVDCCYFCKDVHSGHELICFDGVIRHGSYNNGATPPWESFLVLDLLTPARFMNDLSQTCRSVILASGSLAPLPSLCAELGLVGSNCEPPPDLKAFLKDQENVLTEKRKSLMLPRLQDRPPPLEADHVIDLDRQLLAVAIGQLPSGERLTVSYNQYKHDAFIRKMGDAIATIIESIPRGGVLVFLPSYSLLKKCTNSWKNEGYRRYSDFDSEESDVWTRFLSSKGKVIVETTGSQAEFEASRNEYAETVRTTGNCILLAVFRGKMSEGISFNDDNARGVICVGIPYASSFDRSIKAKKSYNDEQRKLAKRTELLSGDSWYSQTAFRAISQALGRCIRHAGDYGTVVLLDSRHCDESPPDQDGICMAHRKLPSWMRWHVKTLTPRAVHDPTSKLIGGGWPGLQSTMKNFFDTAPVYAAEVLSKQRESLLAAQRRSSEGMGNTKPAALGTAGNSEYASPAVVELKSQTKTSGGQPNAPSPFSPVKEGPENVAGEK